MHVAIFSTSLKKKNFGPKNQRFFVAIKLKVLGHIVSAKGLEADPEKVEAIQAMKTPSNKMSYTDSWD